MHAHISQGSTKGAAITQLGHGIQRAAGLRCHFGCALGIQPRRAVILDVHSGSSPSELSFWMCTRDPAPASCHFGCGIDNQPKEPQSPRMQDSESCCAVILDTALHTRDCATVARHFRDTSATLPRHLPGDELQSWNTSGIRNHNG